MADAINIRDANGVIVPVSVDDVATLNGATVDTHIQRFKLVFGTDATGQDVDATHPLPVSPIPSAGTAFADAATIAAGTYRGVSIKNTSTTANAEIAIRNSGATGLVLDTITLGPNESVRETYPSGRTAASGTIYMQLVSGTVSGTVFSS